MESRSAFSAKDLTVNSISEYENTIASLRREFPEALLFFRGQVVERTLATSILRADAGKDPTMIPDIHYSWSQFAANALSYFDHSTHRRSNNTMAILQHYGARSHFLDVTHDPMIALWFSLNKFTVEGTMIVDESDDPHIFFRPMVSASYIPSSNPNGYVYVIAVPPGLQDTHLVDLEKSMPPSVLRVHRQRAALLSNRDRQFDWNIYVVARLRIADPLTRHVFPEELTYQWLFPTPDEDMLYQELIRVPFFVPFGVTGSPIQVHPLLMIPYYLGSYKKDSHSTASKFFTLLKHLLVTPAQCFFPYTLGRLDDKHEHASEHYAIAEAMPVVVPRVNDWKPLDSEYLGEGILDPDDSRCVAPDVLREQWAASRGNVFLEFALGAHLVHPSKDACVLLRALWVIVELDLIYVAPVWEKVERRAGGMLPGPGMHFRFKDGAYKVDPQAGDCDCSSMIMHLWLLAIFFRATRWWREESCTLVWDQKMGVFHMERPNEDDLTEYPFVSK